MLKSILTTSLTIIIATLQPIMAFEMNAHVYPYENGLKIVPGTYTTTGNPLLYSYSQETDGQNFKYKYSLYNDDFTSVCESFEMSFESGYPDNKPSTYPPYYYVTDLRDPKPHDILVYFTQTLFNSDENYEFIIPIYGNTTAEMYGNICYPKIGFKIVSSNGDILASVYFPDGWQIVYFTLDPVVIVSQTTIAIQISVYSESEPSEKQLLLYTIDRSELGGTIQPKLTNSFTGVSPTLVTNNEPINIELGDIDTNCRIDIFNANGAIVYSTTVTSGTSHITVPTYTLPRGVNIVHISDGNSINKSTKVVVR